MKYISSSVQEALAASGRSSRSLAKHLLRAQLFIYDSILLNLLLESLKTLKLGELSLSFLILLQTRISQKQLIVCLSERRIFRNNVLQTLHGSPIIAPFQRKPGVIVKHRYVVWCEGQCSLQRRFCFIEKALLDSHVPET